MRNYRLGHWFALLCINALILNGVRAQSLFLVAGQSNAVGQGDSLHSVLCKPNTCFEFDASDNRFIPLKDPVGKAWKSFQRAGTGSICPPFAARLNALSGKKIYIITAARSGASCAPKAALPNYGTWDTSGLLFQQAVEKTSMAEALSGLRLSGIIWLQGERDANAMLSGDITADDYETALIDLINRFRAAFKSEIPFYIIQTGYQLDKSRDGSNAVRKIQKEVAEKMKDVYIAYTATNEFESRGWFKDNVHYNQEALNDIGKKTADFVFGKSRRR
jgi:hypothetical protein